jgi:hypothetical protein
VHLKCNHPGAHDLISRGKDLRDFLSDLTTHSTINNNLLWTYIKIEVDDDVIEIYEPMVNGWFTWPFNFDPRWLDSCSGFEGVE